MDGKIYQLATFTDEGFDSHISSIINKEWLDNLGLSIPTNTDELYSVLKAFKKLPRFTTYEFPLSGR